MLGYASLPEALGVINARPRPLALYVFERDRAVVRQVLAHTRSGGVTVNDTLLHIAQDDLPFGSIGASGMGAYHGEEGFRHFSHLRPVFAQSRLSRVRLLQPPYGATFDRLMRWMLR